MGTKNVVSQSGTAEPVIASNVNIKDAFSALDSSASNGPTSGTAVTKSTTLPLFGCRAWVNFDGTSTTSISSEDCCAIRASGNVSKVVRNGTGDYTITFTTAMPDANYCISGNCQRNRSIGSGTYTGITTMPLGSSNYGDAFSTSSIRIQTIFNSGNLLNVDPLAVNVVIFR